MYICIIIKHNINETAGSDLVALSSDKEIPAHTHILNAHSHSHSTTNIKYWSRSWIGEDGHQDSHVYFKTGNNNDHARSLETTREGAHTHTLTELGGDNFNNQPPYYVLTFIIRYK